MKTSPGSNAPRNSNGSSNGNSHSDIDHPPLAHDAHGQPITMPEGAAWWMLKRQTAGRPKVVLGPDRRPVRLTLDATADEIAEAYGPGTYRLDALDDFGNPIDHVTTLEIGGVGHSDDSAERKPILNSGHAPCGDLRFALETIMQMARAQSESLIAVSEAQADWVKGLANAKALPRNAAYTPMQLPPPLPPVVADQGESEEDDDEGDAQNAPALPAYAVVAQAAQGIVHDLPNVVNACTTFANVAANLRNMAARASTATDSPATAPSAPSATSSPRPDRAPNPMVHLSRINERLTLMERRILHRVLRGENADRMTEELCARSVEDAVAYVKEQLASVHAKQASTAHGSGPRQEAPDFMTHVAAVGALLSDDERATVSALFPRFGAVRLAKLQAQLIAMPAADAAAWLRENLSRLAAEVAA